MTRKQHATLRSLIAASALALASGMAVADDNGMGRFGGDSYAYFNQPVAAAGPSWRLSHPNGVSDDELQALSSSDLSAAASRLHPLVLALAPADPSWRETHPGGFSERELQALSSSSLAIWQAPNRPGVTADASRVAQGAPSERVAARR